MEIRRKKHSTILRGLVLVLVLALAMIHCPTELIALAEAAKEYEVDYTYMTLSQNISSSKRVTKGDDFTIPEAKIGGNNELVIGKVSITKDSEPKLQDKDKRLTQATLMSTDVSVSLNGADVEVADGKFTADQEGKYVVTYSYTYTVADKAYTNSYSIEVVSEVSDASFNFKDNYSFVMPSLIDLSVSGAKKEDDSYKDLQLYLPEITDEDGDVVEDLKFYANSAKATEGKYVVITATGGNNIAKVDVSQKMTGEEMSEPALDEDGNPIFYISGENFSKETAGAGKYIIKYSLYDGKNFVKSTTKTVEVKLEKYYEKYALAFEFGSSWSTSAQTGVAVNLPKGTGVTSKNTTPSSESVDVSYKVEVKHKAEGGRYAALNKDLYNSDPENPVLKEVDGHLYLIDPTTFTPLENGDYTFIYTIEDFYGNVVSLDEGAYELLDVTDDTNPTAVVYDASQTEFDEDGNPIDAKDASTKLATNTQSNSVVIYAIGLKDNISKEADSTLERAIYSNEGVLQFTIKDYDNFNLVFNYQNDGTAAYTNLLTNNPLISAEIDAEVAAKTLTEIPNTDEKMLDWLKNHNYLIMIDNGNFAHIFELFETTLTEGLEGVTDAQSLQDKLETLCTTEEGRKQISDLGFAYLPKSEVTTTFGATSGTNVASGVQGMGSSTYGIRYEVTDKAGNHSYSRYYMTIGTSYDNELPEIKFPTTLQRTYVPTATVTFDAPTATDNNDTRMQEVVMYRFLDQDGKPMEVKKDGETVSTNNLTALWKALKADDNKDGQDNRVRYKGEVLAEKYAAYHDAKSGDDKYVDITDKDASTYSIDLKQVENAKSLQIVVYVYDDFGNANLYAQTVTINSSFDKTAPTFIGLEGESGTGYLQGETITLPTLTVWDDAVAYMNFEVQLKHVDEDGKTQVVDPIDARQDRQANHDGAGKYCVIGGRFVASYAGDYNVALAAVDSRGDTIVAFANYTVDARFIVQSPTISSTLPKTQTLEIDDYGMDANGVYKTIEMPIPTISYEISNSVTYDVYSKEENKTTYDADKNTDYVVYGVYEDMTPFDYTVSYGKNGSLTPYEDLYKVKGLGDYVIKYNARIFVYNFKHFEYHEMTQADGKITEEYLSEKNKEGVTITFGDDDIYVKVNSKGTFVFRMENDEIAVYKLKEDGTISETKETDENIKSNFGVDNVSDVSKYYNEIKLYNLPSEEYTITLADTKAPGIVEYEYDEQISVERFEEEYGNTVKVRGIATKADASGIDIDRSSTTLSWRLSNGTSSATSRTGKDAFSDWEYKVTGATGLNGTYTITYNVYDNAGNLATSTHQIVIGDNVPPTLTFPTNYVKDTYEIGSEFKIDLGKIEVKDSDIKLDDPEFTVTLTNTSTGNEIELVEDSSNPDILKCTLDEVGSYTLTIKADDNVGNTATETFKFEVTSKTSSTTKVYQVVGTVLIVISVLVLAGVIIYFIVSKVKLDKELKK